MSDSFCVMRSGHLCVPVKKEYKFRISGSVIDKSSTGNTLFIEPAAVQKYEEELSMLLIQEDNEVRRILYTLTAMIGEQLGAFRENSRIMERLDYAFRNSAWNGTVWPRSSTRRGGFGWWEPGIR